MTALEFSLVITRTAEAVAAPIAAVRMASQTPAEILGLPDKGRIESGADADLVVLDGEGSVQETIVDGETVYQRERGKRDG